MLPEFDSEEKEVRASVVEEGADEEKIDVGGTEVRCVVGSRDTDDDTDEVSVGLDAGGEVWVWV